MSENDRRRGAGNPLQGAREDTIAVLEMRHSRQRLERAEYERRVEEARRATTTEQLESLLREPARSQAPVPRHGSAVEATELHPSDEQGFVFALLGGAQRKGQWDPPARLYVASVMGGVELDFREADLLEGATEVIILAVMGGVNIVVPPDVDVDANGIGLMGGFKSLSRRARDRDAPTIRIKGLAVMGGVNVKVK